MCREERSDGQALSSDRERVIELAFPPRPGRQPAGGKLSWLTFDSQCQDGIPGLLQYLVYTLILCCMLRTFPPKLSDEACH